MIVIFIIHILKNNINFKQSKSHKNAAERNNAKVREECISRSVFVCAIYISSGITKMCAGYATSLNVQEKENYSTHKYTMANVYYSTLMKRFYYGGSVFNTKYIKKNPQLCNNDLENFVVKGDK